MADALHRLNREQLLELLHEQSQELEQQKELTAKAEAKVAELTAKLENIGDSAIAIFKTLAEARAAKKAAEEQAQQILAEARAAAQAQTQPAPEAEPVEEAEPATDTEPTEPVEETSEVTE